MKRALAIPFLVAGGVIVLLAAVLWMSGDLDSRLGPVVVGVAFVLVVGVAKTPARHESSGTRLAFLSALVAALFGGMGLFAAGRAWLAGAALLAALASVMLYSKTRRAHA